MIEELLDKLETNMKDLEDKYADVYIFDNEADIEEALQNFKTGMINEWNYFIPQGLINTLGIEFIKLYDCHTHWSLTKVLITVIMKNIDHPDVKLALSNFRKKQLSEDFKKD